MDPFLSELVENPRALSRPELIRLLEWPNAKELFGAAYEVKVREVVDYDVYGFAMTTNDV